MSRSISEGTSEVSRDLFEVGHDTTLLNSHALEGEFLGENPILAATQWLPYPVRSQMLWSGSY